jgi:L-lactate dehydrogenase complex protein LldG
MATGEEMLDRIRKALGRPSGGALNEVAPFISLAGVMPPLTPNDYLAKFESELERVGGIAYRVTNFEELDAVFVKIMRMVETQSVVLSRNPLLAEVRAGERLTALNMFVTSYSQGSGLGETNSLSDFTKASFEAGAGVTGVDFVLAETGTLVLSSATEGVQVASLAPPIHIALYRRRQLVGSLDEVLAGLNISASKDTTVPGRSVVFVTGTSRTADIEQILIRGVHGPREMHAILIEDSCLSPGPGKLEANA